jgi:hypothetical protein
VCRHIARYLHAGAATRLVPAGERRQQKRIDHLHRGFPTEHRPHGDRADGGPGTADRRVPQPPQEPPTPLRGDRPKVGDHLARWRSGPDRTPCRIGQPALRALTAEGYTSLEQLTQVTAPEFGRLHGIGPKAARLLGEALAAQGLSFRQRGASAPEPSQHAAPE